MQLLRLLFWLCLILRNLFLIECDASGLGEGAVLMQGHRPIAFLSKALKPCICPHIKKSCLFLSLQYKSGVHIWLAGPLW